MPTQNNEWLLGETFRNYSTYSSLKITNLQELFTGSVHTKNESSHVIETTFS